VAKGNKKLFIITGVILIRVILMRVYEKVLPLLFFLLLLSYLQTFLKVRIYKKKNDIDNIEKYDFKHSEIKFFKLFFLDCFLSKTIFQDFNLAITISEGTYTLQEQYSYTPYNKLCGFMEG